MTTVLQTAEFSKWLKRLKDTEARARILVIIQRLGTDGKLRRHQAGRRQRL